MHFIILDKASNKAFNKKGKVRQAIKHKDKRCQMLDQLQKKTKSSALKYLTKLKKTLTYYNFIIMMNYKLEISKDMMKLRSCGKCNVWNTKG